jgi:hypothetical protein
MTQELPPLPEPELTYFGDAFEILKSYTVEQVTGIQAEAYAAGLAAARVEGEPLRADAERYRFWADLMAPYDHEKVCAVFGCFEDTDRITREQLSAAIDAAIAAKKGTTK